MRRCFVALCVMVALAGCRPEPVDADRPVVVVSVPPQADIVERLAGDLVAIEVMIPPGASPATYEPSMRQMRAMAQARLYVKVGHPSFPFERAWLDRLLEQSPGVAVVDCAHGLRHRAGDPHVWVAPSALRVMAASIADALVDVLPGHEASVRAALERLLADIDALDRDILTRLEAHRGAEFLVFHPAWGYFADDYGLKQVSIEHEHKEPSAAELAHLIEHARDSGVKVVFVQPQFSRASAELVAREIGATVVTLDPLARDWRAGLLRAAQAIDEALTP